MRKSALTALLLLVFILAGCSEQITEDDLIGGKWTANAGFENEEAGGEPVCGYYAKGLEFKDKKTVYVEEEEENFKYRLSETEGMMEIEFYPPRIGIDPYKIYKVNENAFGIIGPFRDIKNSCYFEREK